MRGRWRIAAAGAAVVGTTLAPGPAVGAPVIAAAGDIACRPGADATRVRCQDARTARLLVGNSRIEAVLALGDEQYPTGSLRQFQHAYARTWGRVFRRTRPGPGNHEYAVPGAHGYFRYFGGRAGPRRKGWYAFRVGRWHIVALNGNCFRVGGCGNRAPQTRWLRANLDRHARRCTLAFWHQPRFSTGLRGEPKPYDEWWRILYAHHVDVVLNGHYHDYERYARQTPGGKRDRRHGIREFIVGTGGVNLARPHGRLRNLQFRQHRHFGVLKLTLHRRRYDWRFVTGGRRVLDRGSTACH